MKDLPLAVQKAAAAESARAEIRGFSEEQENGKTYYELQLILKGHTKDVLMDADGNIVEIEEEVAFDSLSAEVQAGLRAKAGAAKILKVESLTRSGKLVAYEAQIESNGKKREIQFHPPAKTS
ncbi:MAG TPA: hypothetical protein VMT51_10805 [Dongiaceae bacterium]|nr:hypothetical protein [Dongiaceae bacterium]